MEHQKNFDRDQPKEFVEKLIKLNRTAKVVKGGRRFSFSALTVVGDQKGRVGFGFGKANDVTEAIKKSIDKAKRNLVMVPIKNGTIPHDILGTYKSSSVLLKPACSGTGIIAGGPVRAVLEAAGATDVLAKSLGSNPVTYSETATNPFAIHSYILIALGCNILEYKNSLRLSIIPSLSKANLKTYPSMRIPTRFVPDPNCDHGNLYLSKRS